MIKDITYEKEARVKLKSGFDKLARAVAVTLGPKGRNVVLDKGTMFPTITKDGVSVAKEIFLSDSVENLGAQMLKQVAMNTNHQAGDGTTTAIVLARAILDLGFEEITNGKQPIDVKRDMDSTLQEIIDLLDRYATEIKGDYKKIYEVANISSNGDQELAELMANLFEKSKDSVILLEQSDTKETYTDFIQGMSFKSSYTDSFFVNNNNRECVYKDAYVLIYEGKIKSVKELMPVIEAVSYLNKPLVIIAEQLSQDALLTLFANKNKGKLESVVLNAPGFGPGRKEQLTDIAIYTGGESIKDGALNSFDITQLGKVEQITVKEDVTTITGGNGDKKDIENRIADLTSTLKNYEGINKQKIEEKISKFKGGIGVIYIGANSELEYKEKYDRIEDAVNAVNAAIDEGIISGGGTTLYEISNQIDDSLLSEAIRAPYIQIKKNSGITEYNSTLDYNRYLNEGIIDPKKVTRIALENAVSVAGTVLTTECVIVNK